MTLDTSLHIENQDLCHITTLVTMPLFVSESSEAVWLAGILTVFSAIILWAFLLLKAA